MVTSVCMKTKQLLAVFGSILLFVGVFTPLVSLPIVGSLNYFQNGKGDGIFVLVLAALSLILALTRSYERLWLTAGGSLAVLTFTFVRFEMIRQQMLSVMDRDLSGNPFAGLARLAVDSVQIQWGWALLLVGVGMVIAGAALKDEHDSSTASFSIHTKALAIVGVIVLVAVGTWAEPQVGKWRSASTRPPGQVTSATPDAKPTRQSSATSTEASQYIAKLDLSRVKGGMSKGTLTCYDHECPAVWGRIKNMGDRTLSRVVVTAYFPDSSGKVVFEKQYSAVTTGGFMSHDSPLRPGYIKEFGYVVEGCPSECVPANVRVTVTDVDFLADGATDPNQ